MSQRRISRSAEKAIYGHLELEIAECRKSGKPLNEALSEVASWPTCSEKKKKWAEVLFALAILQGSPEHGKYSKRGAIELLQKWGYPTSHLRNIR